MIAINLLPGAKRKGGKGPSFKMPDLKALTAVARDPWLIAGIAAWVGVAVVILFFWFPRSAAVRDLEPELGAVRREARRLQTVLRQKTETEARRDTLLMQIDIIRNIDRERYTWPHILDAVARALPPYTWLDDLSPRGGEEGAAAAFQLSGKSADIQAITRFVRNLEESPFLQNASTVSTGIVNEQGRDVYTFIVNVSYQRPDSTLLTMQPLAASLVQGFRSGVRRR
jgi:Tfp pilus assembly protein PilN